MGAEEVKAAEAMRAARGEGLAVDDEESPDGEWQVSWMIRAYDVDISLSHPPSS